MEGIEWEKLGAGMGKAMHKHLLKIAEELCDETIIGYERIFFLYSASKLPKVDIF